MKKTLLRATLYTLCLGAALLAATGVRAQTYTIPVVVHVLWDGYLENITDAQVLNAVEVLNTGFNSLSFEPIDDTTYQDLAASMDIEFCLATIAPDGSPTTGIERFETPLADMGGLPGSYMNQWPPERYLNLWTVGALDTTFGSTLSPAEAALNPAMDGIMLPHFMFGQIGTSTYFQGKAIIFHAGRYLNLKLIWEDPIDGGPCGDDEVADTPPSQDFLACIQTGPDGCAGNLPLMLENYMTYSYCNRMFTQGQKERAHAALNSPVAQRNNLWSAENLGLTGCGPMTVAVAEQRPSATLSVMAQGDDQWLVHGPASGAWSLGLYTTTGLLVGSWHSAQGPVSLDLSGHARGMYVLKAVSAGAYRGHAKVVVE
ncbi:MAG: hypothetical protein IT230_01765 [Flavobacteriales bacterium]|nr:hypothetical protein [Flavobacteriales bacterium]